MLIMKKRAEIRRKLFQFSDSILSFAVSISWVTFSATKAVQITILIYGNSFIS